MKEMTKVGAFRVYRSRLDLSTGGALMEPNALCLAPTRSRGSALSKLPKSHFGIAWIVFDRDQVQGFDEIIDEAERKGIQVGWSNPCFEIWMYAYFGSMPAISDSWTCCSEFGRVYEAKTGQKYSKADEQMYGKFCKVGDEEKALQIAQQKLSTGSASASGKVTTEGFVVFTGPGLMKKHLQSH
ncbi:MAG: RloB family protein [Lachnospiraceae bacterium]|nr:RloB family protein [Lachnospiraceae bacterium]